MSYLFISVLPFFYSTLYGQQLPATSIPNDYWTASFQNIVVSAQKGYDWQGLALPIESYSEYETKLQKKINLELGEFLIADAIGADSSEWLDFDFEEITPYTWKWVDLVQYDSLNESHWISIRRPTWWLNRIQIHHVGDSIWLDLPHMGIHGWATVTDIRINQLDTRFMDTEGKSQAVIKPITGKFVHHSTNLFDLFFENQEKPMSVTGNHPFWSVDRNQWIGAEKLDLGEKVKTLDGFAALINRERKNGTYEVYNLEVYQYHNYFVSPQKILVHNNCWDELWFALRKKIRDMDDIGLSVPNKIEEAMVFKVNGKDLNVMGDFYMAREFDEVLLTHNVARAARKAAKKAKVKNITVRIETTEMSMRDVSYITNGFIKEGFKVKDVKMTDKLFIEARTYAD